MKVSKATIIRTICLAIAIVNIILEMSGRSILPIDNELVTEAVSIVFLIASAVASWWKNNSFTKNAIQADEVLKALNNGEIMDGELVEEAVDNG